MSKEFSREDVMSSETDIEDLIWWPPSTKTTLNAYLEQKNDLRYKINNLKNKDSITTTTKDKLYIPYKDLDINEDTSKLYIKGQVMPIEIFESYPSEMTISSQRTDFIINFQEHNYNIKYATEEVTDEEIATAMMADIDILKLLKKENYNAKDEYKTEKDKVYF